MKSFDWDDAKNAKLRAERGIGFEDVAFHVERDDLLDTSNTRAPTVTAVSVPGVPSPLARSALRPRLPSFVRQTMMAVGGAENPIPTVTELPDDVSDDVVSARWVLPPILGGLKSRTCASLTMSLQAISVTQTPPADP